MIEHSSKFRGISKNANFVIIPKNNKKLEEQNFGLAKNLKTKKAIYLAWEISNGWKVEKYSAANS